jgi:hypothetical protein
MMALTAKMPPLSQIEKLLTDKVSPQFRGMLHLRSFFQTLIVESAGSIDWLVHKALAGLACRTVDEPIRMGSDLWSNGQISPAFQQNRTMAASRDAYGGLGFPGTTTES